MKNLNIKDREKKMKKRLFLLICPVILGLVYSGPALEIDNMIPSPTKTASAAIITEAGFFYGLTIVTDGTNTATVDVYDNASGASGTKLIPTWIVPSSATSRVQTYNLYPPVIVANGIYVNLSVAGGGTASYMAYYFK